MYKSTVMSEYKIATNIKSGEMLNNEMAILNRLKGTQSRKRRGTMVTKLQLTRLLDKLINTCSMKSKCLALGMVGLVWVVWDYVIYSLPMLLLFKNNFFF